MYDDWRACFCVLSDWLSAFGDCKIAKTVAEGGEESEPHKDDVTALMVAAQGGHLETVKLLLDNGADVRAKDEEDITPLLNAVKGNFGEVAQLLVERGADPNDVYKDDKGIEHNLVFDSISVGNEDFPVLLLSKGASASFKDESGATALIQAAHKGLPKVIKALLEAPADAGVDKAAATEEGVTPIIAAAMKGHDEIVGMLLEGGCAADAMDKDGTSGLMAAASNGHLEVVTKLVEAKANMNAQNNDGHSALMFAYNGKAQVATLMDKYAQYLEDADDEGESTKMMREALDQTQAIIDLLMKNGADPSLKDKEGRTAEDFDFKPE
ncbi:unnamed protein product, partial [Choristocarpus tenellus]